MEVWEKYINNLIYEVTHTLLYLKCIKLASMRSNFPCINIGVRIELNFHLYITVYLFSGDLK